MKKLLVSLCMILFAASTGWAITIGPWEYSDADTILGYEALHPANETEELAFANAVLAALGMEPTELLYGTGMKVEFVPDGGKDIVYDPGFAWVYAVVKVDGPNDFSYLLMDTDLVPGGDDILQTPLAGTEPYNMHIPPLGISHITWFGPGAPVPEPSTMLLFGVGLAGLGFYARKRNQK